MCDYPVEVVEAMWTSHGAIVRVTVAPNRHSSSPLVLDSGLGDAQHFGQAIGGTGVLGPARGRFTKHDGIHFCKFSSYSCSIHLLESADPVEYILSLNPQCL